MALLLNADLLERLHHGWVQQAAPIVEHLRPGLPEDQIDEPTADLGLQLSDEAQTWWGWHNGVDVTLGALVELGPSLPFPPLGNAASLCRLFGQQAKEVWGDQAERWWRTSWFPVTERLGAIRCDCAVEPGAPTPIYYADSHDYDLESLSVPKLDAMVSWWAEALGNGAWTYDGTRGRWERQTERLPAERRDSDLL